GVGDEPGAEHAGHELGGGGHVAGQRQPGDRHLGARRLAGPDAVERPLVGEPGDLHPGVQAHQLVPAHAVARPAAVGAPVGAPGPRRWGWGAAGVGGGAPPPPPPPAPMEARSFMSVVSATAHPWLTSPSRWSSGTRTSLKNTSLNEAPPVIWRSGRTSTPGACMSTTNPVSPWCLGRSGSVRQMTSPMSLYWAPEVHTFWPVTIHSSPSRSARVWRPARSDPAPGSLNSWQPTRSPRYRAGR